MSSKDLSGYTIVIIGVGASGVASFIHLVLKWIVQVRTKNISIALIERKMDFGPGLAYGTGQEGHLLNTKAGLMGIFAEEPLHFIQWMHEHQEMIKKDFPQAAIHPDAYPPRMLYGIYIKDTLNQYITIAHKYGIKVTLISSEVLDAEISAKKITCIMESGEQIIADIGILATGTPEAASFKNLRSIEQYLSSPWPAQQLLQKIKNKKASVTIIGSSLTAIDAVMTLVTNKHRGPINLFSINGLLPRVQAPRETSYERKLLTLSNIRKLIRTERRSLRVKDLIRLFMQEVEGALKQKINWKDTERIGKSPVNLLKEDIHLALKGKNIFQDILFSLRYISYDIWKLLPEDQKLLYGRWIKPYVDINRHPIPLENGIKLLNLLESKQLNVISHSKEILWDDSRLKFILQTKEGVKGESDYVINATGPTTAIEKMDDIPLLRTLHHKKQIVAYKPGGVQADLNTMKITVRGIPNAPVYGVGHLLIGLQHDVNALWFNIARIDEMTDAIIKRLV
ncbi:FAD/NAD(P)-binding protein [Olivibacter sp. SDN3]|uniref:FAD/NAD(P)-binding protein n=1 Tax=Olivibacter sp. SDN3 TaxID=2764720 RepID=UPI001650EFE9|nr:FAD/NAD(P)-binding protein [Olivibacter sp. SDN3]QNL49066.1 FAD/NAD(P)-binding protein [Olivibacter sp. SDN3]